MDLFEATLEDPARDGPRAGAIALLALLIVFILVHTNLVVITGLSHYYDGRRILQILLLVSMTLVLVASSSLRDGIMDVLGEISPASKGALIAVVAAGVMSSLRAPLPAAGLREVALFSVLGVLAVAVAAARRALDRRFDLSLVIALVAAGLIYTAIFIVLRRAQITLLGFESLFSTPQHYFYGWSNARFFGQVGLWVFPLLVAGPLVLRNRSRITRAGAWLAAVCWWALVIEAGGRGSILFTVVAVVAAAILLGRVAWTWTKAAAGALAGGTAVWFVASRLMYMLYAPEPDGGAARRSLTPAVERAIERGASDNVRFAFWQDALEMIGTAPFLGVGPEHYAYYQQTLHTAAPHNVPLQLAAEWGIPVAMVLAVLGLWAGRAWIRTWRGSVGLNLHTRSIVPALTAAAVGAGMLGMVEGVIVTPASQVMLAVVVGWMLAVYTSVPDTRSGSSGHRGWLSHTATSVGIVTLMSVVIWTAGPYLWSPNEALEQQIEEHELGSLQPRFWVQGRLFDE